MRTIRHAHVRIGTAMVGAAAMAIATLATLPTPAATASTITTQTFTGDSSSGISTSNTYTQAVNLAGPALTINGVSFIATGSVAGTTITGSNYTLNMPALGTYSGYGDNLSGQVGVLCSTFYYQSFAGTSSSATATLTLSSLSPSTAYKLVFYDDGFGGGTRTSNVTDSQGSSLVYDENQGGTDAGSLLIDTYTTAATGTGSTSFSISFLEQSQNDSTQLYGFTNQVVPEPATLGLMAIGGVGLLLVGRQRRSTHHA